MRLQRTVIGLLLLLSLLACAPGGGPGGSGNTVAVTVAPNAVQLQPGQPQTFLATVTGTTNAGVSWSVNESGGGQINASGQYLAPQVAGTFHVRATSAADPTKSGQATVTVTAPPVVAIGVSPATASVQVGQPQAFTATVTGTANTAVTWSVVEAGGGSVSNAGLYTAPAIAGTFHVRATSVADSTKSAQATVTVTAAPVVAVAVSPATISLQTGQQQAFTATVTGTCNPAVIWTVVEAGGGSVSGAGQYTAPAIAGTFHVRATSVADSTKSAQATVTVISAPVVAVAVSPTTVSLQTGQQQAFTATVTGTSILAVTWTVVEAGGGSVDGTGTYTAPSTAGIYHVRATSDADPGKSDQATVTVTTAPVVSIAISPATTSLQVGQQRQFTASVTGTANTAVTWNVVEAGGGSVSGAGLYTTPAAPGTFHVRATSVADSTKSAQATVTVTAAPTVVVAVSPATASLQTGQQQAFTATVTGTANTAVTWSVVEAGGGSVSGAGLYTAPGTVGTYHVRATSVADSTKSAQATVTVAAVPPTSGYLLLTAARLTQIRADANAGGATWTALRTNVETQLASTDPYSTGAENMALAYLISADPRYAVRAYWWAQQLMAMNLSRDSYYDFGEILQGVAMVLNYCGPALSPAQATTLANFLEAAADELWFHPIGSGWGLDNPRNNYHHTFLLGTACAGYALQFRGDARGARWTAKVQDLLERPDGVLNYLINGVPGGDWDEGMNYAQGSVMHLGQALAIVAAAGGRNYFTSAPFFQNHPRFTVYASQPDWRSLYPGGDLAWDSSMPVSPFRRAMLQPILAWLPDSTERRLGQWFLNHAIPSYMDGGRTFNWRTALFLDVVFALPLAETDPAGQPLAYRTPTTNWINLRSGWDAQATSLSISGSPRMLESHQHADTGSFTLWKQGWQAVDASTFSHSGLLAVPEAHNLLRVPNRYSGIYSDNSLVPGVTRFADATTHGYVQVDATRLYRWVVSSSDVRDLLNEHTREFVYLRPNTLVLFDRVDARADAAGYAWCLHFPVAPTLGSGRYSAVHQGGGMSLVNLLGGAPSVVPDSDLEAGTASVRVEEAATGLTSRFLNVLEVASGAAPTTTAQLVSTPGAVQGARVGDTVVLFSDRPRGLPPVLPFSYTVSGTGSLTHLLYNLDVPVSAQLSASGGNTVVTVSAGSTYTPDAQGHVRFVAAPGASISISVSPATASVQTIQTQAFTATVTGTATTAVTWSVVEAGGGSVNSAGLYTAPAAPGTFHVRATSVADSTRSAQATVTVTAPPVVNVSVSPATISLWTGQQQAFTATVTGTANTAVTWSVVEAGGGSVSGTGLYTAPATPGTFHVRATSVADSTKSAQATATVAAPPPPGPCNAASLGIGASLNGYRPFPSDNPWNQDVSGLPVDPNSANIIAFIGATRGLKADFGAGLWEGAPIGIPYQVVDAAQAKVRINFTAYGDESDPGPMPIPPTAPIEGGSASTGDRHVLVLDRDACLLYELYRAFPQGDGSWNADSSAVWDLRSNNLRPFGWTSTDAAGLPVFPGLARYDEVAAGEITHALRFTVPTTRRAYVLPATHWASSNTSTSAPPMGMRVRLKADVVITGFPTQAQVVLRALKKYGMILADNGSAWYITGAPDERWINDQLASLSGIKGSDLEVVQMGTVYTADPTGPAPAIGSFSASPTTVAAGAASTLSWSASNATRFFLTPGVGWVTGTSFQVRPQATTTYTLLAEGPYGAVTRSVTVTVSAPQPPSISSFTATPGTIAAGQSSTLAWVVTGATGLSIDRGVGAVTGTSTVVSPTATTVYTLTATNGSGTMTATATVNVSGALPVISGLQSSAIGAVTATLAWTTDRPCRSTVTYQRPGGPVQTRSFTDLATSRSLLLDLLEPARTYAVSVVATDASGTASTPATLQLTTASSAVADVTVTIDPATTQAISPWIYGLNFYGSVAGAPPRLTLNRMGGNRWTAYNWENNASNSGSDWGPYSNDSYLGGGSTPAEAVRSVIAADQGRGMASLMTIQLQGYVSADKNGLVNIGDPNHLTARFKQVVFRKGSAFTATPSTTDSSVYMDEFLWALRGKFGGDIFAASATTPTFVSLDNEPELWGDTHAEIQTGLISPSAYIQKTIDLAKALKDVAPDVQLFGPVHYGFNGIVNWQSSAGFTSSYWFTDKYLQELKVASDAYGKRLLDAYDLHWYSEANGDGVRITNLNGATLTANQVQAIVQSPRSLWDSTYTENSWIAQYLGQPINLLGRLKAKIAADWPGTKIAITEYGNGGDNHIAGALAQADNLGIFGAQGVFAANLWPLNDCPYILAGFRAFRGFDGGSASFGDVSMKATSSSVQNVAAYVSLDSQVPGRVVFVAINRGTSLRVVSFQGQALAGTASVYRITAESAQAQRAAAQPVAPVLAGLVPVGGTSWAVALPPMSVTTVEVH